MKQYQIIKYQNYYAIASKEDLKQYNTTCFLPYDHCYYFKNDLLEFIKSNTKYKNNTDLKTIKIY